MRVFVMLAAVLSAGVACGQDCPGGRCPVPPFGTAVVMPALQPVSYQQSVPFLMPAEQSAPVQSAPVLYSAPPPRFARVPGQPVRNVFRAVGRVFGR